jgi:FKBP-type peptidyl-prolyl cis-trans isomerase
MYTVTKLAVTIALAGLLGCTEQPGSEHSTSSSTTPPVTMQDNNSKTWSDGDTIPSGKDGVADIQILKVHGNGSGPACGPGKRATLAYTAMLANGKVLDPGTRPFSFKVGAGEAISGWDVVVAEMRVGDSFTIMLPQELAYGPSKGDLKFDMELLSFK